MDPIVHDVAARLESTTRLEIAQQPPHNNQNNAIQHKPRTQSAAKDNSSFSSRSEEKREEVRSPVDLSASAPALTREACRRRISGSTPVKKNGRARKPPRRLGRLRNLFLHPGRIVLKTGEDCREWVRKYIRRPRRRCRCSRPRRPHRKGKRPSLSLGCKNGKTQRQNPDTGVPPIPLVVPASPITHTPTIFLDCGTGIKICHISESRRARAPGCSWKTQGISSRIQRFKTTVGQGISSRT